MGASISQRLGGKREKNRLGIEHSPGEHHHRQEKCHIKKSTQVLLDLLVINKWSVNTCSMCWSVTWIFAFIHHYLQCGHSYHFQSPLTIILGVPRGISAHRIIARSVFLWHGPYMCPISCPGRSPGVAVMQFCSFKFRRSHPSYREFR